MARSSSSNGHLDKHLKDPFTTRDLLGVCRGRCVSKTCPGCPGGYLKCTADYYAKPPPLDPRAFAEESSSVKHAPEEANRPERAEPERAPTENTSKMHPDNDPTLTRCSRCGCSSIDHEIAHADDARARGNDAFATGDLRAAITAYSQALAAAPGDAKAYSNRAAAILALGGNPGGALEDASRAARIEPEWAKARVRVGEALTALGRHDEAARAYGVAAKLDPAYRAAAAEAASKAARAERTNGKFHETAAASKKKTTQTPPVPMMRTSASSVASSESAGGRVPPGDAADAARVACERLASSVAAAARAAQDAEDAARSAAARRDALAREIRELETRKASAAKTVAALHSEARAARDAAAAAARGAASRADGETQTGEDQTPEDADAAETANEQPGAPAGRDEAHAATHEEEEVEEEEEEVEVEVEVEVGEEVEVEAEVEVEVEGEVEGEGGGNSDADVLPASASARASIPPSQDKTSETLRFFESFRRAFGDADDGDDDTPEPVDETGAEAALEAWAEKWEREQWERRNASARRAARGSEAGDENTLLRKKHSEKLSSSSARVSRVDASGLAELLAASSRPSVGDKDHENRARGPCRSCMSRADPAARCSSFARRSGWQARGAEALAPLARASPEDAAASALAFGCVSISAHAFARAAAASRVEAARDGALCARCGCAAEAHASRQDTARMLRRSAAARDAAAEEETARLRRVAACASRVREARERGDTIRETHADAVSGAERAGCARCGPARCRRFRCAFAELDAANPECVLFCSDCGCAAASHPVCAEWERRNDRERAEQVQAQARAQAAAQAAREERAARRGRRVAEDAAARTRARDLAALGLGSGSESVGAHALARAYKKAALRWHPDKKGGDAEKFVAAAEAFRRLRERASGAG